MPPDRAARRLVRALHGLEPCRADGRGPQHAGAAQAAVHGSITSAGTTATAAARRRTSCCTRAWRRCRMQRRPTNSALPVAWHNSTWIGDRTIEFLRANKDKPFCAWASFLDPHHPFDCPEPWSRLHHPDEVDLPEHRIDGSRAPPVVAPREPLRQAQARRPDAAQLPRKAIRARRCRPTNSCAN